jgi:alpha-tubulin suppressor-like RCC1 family protein
MTPMSNYALGNIYVAGRNTNGELSVGHTNNVLTFTQVQRIEEAPVDLDYVMFGPTHAISIDVNGVLYGSGTNDTGELARDDLTDKTRFVPTDSPGVTILPTQYYPTNDYSYPSNLGYKYSTLRQGDSWIAVGFDNNVQLTGNEETPLSDFTSDWQIPASEDISCFAVGMVDDPEESIETSSWMLAGRLVTGSYKLYHIGFGGPGGTGVGIGAINISATDSHLSSYNVVKIAAGEQHAWAMMAETGLTPSFGTMACVGSNEFGQLGLSSGISYVLDLSDYWSVYESGYLYDFMSDPLDVWAGADFTIVHAITTEDVLGPTYDFEYTYSVSGRNNVGQLGLGDTTNRFGFVRNNTLTDLNPRYIYCGLDNVVVQTHEGDIYGWGGNSEGTLGLGDTTDRLVPTLLKQSTASEQWDIKGFGYGKLALEKNGTLRSNFKGWGENNEHELGIPFHYDDPDYGPINIYRPRYLADFRVKKIATDSEISVIIKEDGTLWICGDNGNNDGYLGVGANNISTWQQVGTDTDWAHVTVTLGYYKVYSFLAIKEDGTMWGWGDDDQGKLGTFPQPAGPVSGGWDNHPLAYPTQVGTDSDWATCILFGTSACALKTNGTLWFCGENVNSHWGPVWANSNTQTLMATYGVDYGTFDSGGEGLLRSFGNWIQSTTDNFDSIDISGYSSQDWTFIGVRANTIYIGGQWTDWSSSEMGFSSQGYPEVCTFLTIPDFSGNVAKAEKRTDSMVILTTSGELYGRFSLTPLTEYTHPVNGSISSGMFTNIGGADTWIDFWIAKYENVVFAQKDDGTIWCMPYITSGVPDVWDNGNNPILGQGPTGTTPEMVFTQVGTAANYITLAPDYSHVLAITGPLEA